MPEPHEWEWLKQPSNEKTEVEQELDSVHKLRRWVDPVREESSTHAELSPHAEPSDSDANVPSPELSAPDLPQSDLTEEIPQPSVEQLSREQRRQQLKQVISAQIDAARIDSPQMNSPQIDSSQNARLDSPENVRSHSAPTVSPLPQPSLPPAMQVDPSVKQADKRGAKKPMGKKKDDYREHLKQEFTTLFDNLALQPQQKHYLKSRWLDQVIWMEGKAGKARDMHYRLRLTTIIGGVIIPALVSLNFTSNDQIQFKQAIAASTFVLSQAVAICAATEQFFNYGDRWRHYRRSVETLKTQGWQFLELTGPYESSKTHEQAFRLFASQVEQILQHDVEIYSTQVSQPDNQKDNQDENQSSRIPTLDVNSKLPDIVRTP